MDYPLSNIKAVTNDTLVYEDHQHDEKTIDLIECARNRAAYRKQDQNEAHSVGTRDASADKPYYEFFTDPHIVFVLEPKRGIFGIRKRFDYTEFRRIEQELEKQGWSTLDLS